MKHLLLFAYTFLGVADTFATDACVELVVVSDKSESQLHFMTMPTNAFERPRVWSFPPLYTGHRADCRLLGSSTNDSFCAWTGGSEFIPGNPFGSSAGRESRRIELTKTSAIFARVNLYTGKDDRVETLGDAAGDILFKSISSDARETADVARSQFEHVRVVPYAVAGAATNAPVLLAPLVLPRIVAEFDLSRDTKPFISEHDIITNGCYDIDWVGFRDEIQNHSNVSRAVGDVTKVWFRLVFGRTGPIQIDNSSQPSDQLRAFERLIERRFEKTANRTVPTFLHSSKSSEGEMAFSFRLDEYAEDGYDAALYGKCSYTAYQLQITSADAPDWTSPTYDSGTLFLQERTQDGRFIHRAASPGGGRWKWRVRAYNAKFGPSSRTDGWSAAGYFTVDD